MTNSFSKSTDESSDDSDDSQKESKKRKNKEKEDQESKKRKSKVESDLEEEREESDRESGGRRKSIQKREEIYYGDKSELVSNEVLDRNHLVFNQFHKILICVHPNCGFQLTSKFHYHFKYRKDHKRVSEEDEKSILNFITNYVPIGEYEHNIDIQSRPQTVLKTPEKPIQGLMIHKGFECLSCHHLLSSKSTMYQHFREKHPSDTTAMRDATFQRFFYQSKPFKVKILTFFPPFFLPFSFFPLFLFLLFLSFLSFLFFGSSFLFLCFL